MNSKLQTSHTHFNAAIGRDMQELVVGYAAKVMLASFAFKGTKEDLSHLRQEFAATYAFAAQVLSTFTHKKIKPENLRNLGFSFNPTQSALVMSIRHEWQGKLKDYRIVFQNETGEFLPVALEKKERAIAAKGETANLLRQLLEDL